MANHTLPIEKSHPTGHHNITIQPTLPRVMSSMSYGGVLLPPSGCFSPTYLSFPLWFWKTSHQGTFLHLLMGYRNSYPTHLNPVEQATHRGPPSYHFCLAIHCAQHQVWSPQSLSSPPPHPSDTTCSANISPPITRGTHPLYRSFLLHPSFLHHLDIP